MKDHQNKFIVILVVLAAIAALILFYFGVLDGTAIRPVLVFTADIVPVQAEYHPGDTVYATFSYCKYRDIPGLVQWTLLNHRMVFYTPQIRNSNETGCKTGIVIPIEELSPLTLPGEYHFSGTITYSVNPIRQIVVPMRTGSFTVVQ